jgi:ATP-dependent DNA helicase RecG
VVLSLPGGGSNLEFVRITYEESQAGRPLSLDDLLLVNELWIERRLTTAGAARLIQKPETEARARLAHLVEVGLVEARGEGAGRAYHLSANIYRRLGDKAGYVRQRGFDGVQQEQMVLQYAQSHGRITRTEAAELCQLTSVQARYLLSRLTRQGLLRRSGTGKGTFYEPVAPKPDRAKQRRPRR